MVNGKNDALKAVDEWYELGLSLFSYFELSDKTEAGLLLLRNEMINKINTAQ
jgi:hypothetical protein